jgi:hypothetical protein
MKKKKERTILVTKTITVVMVTMVANGFSHVIDVPMVGTATSVPLVMRTVP